MSAVTKTAGSEVLKALHAVMKKVGYVQKQGVNDFHKYKYASEADLLSALRPAMVEAGLLLLPSIRDLQKIDDHGNTTVVVEYTLAHISGEVWPEKIVIAGTGNDRSKTGVGDKGVYKALTGANKYLLFKLFQIETGDDPENDTRQQDDLEKTKNQYISSCEKFIVNGCTTSEELKEWWLAEAENRKNLGLLKGDDTYAYLHRAFVSRGKQMVATELKSGGNGHGG